MDKLITHVAAADVEDSFTALALTWPLWESRTHPQASALLWFHAVVFAVFVVIIIPIAVLVLYTHLARLGKPHSSPGKCFVVVFVLLLLLFSLLFPFSLPFPFLTYTWPVWETRLILKQLLFCSH